VRALCLHGHFYQPPREHPWLGVVEPEPSAAPHRDWNVRITSECYRPNAAARVLDEHGRLAALVDNYAFTSFNFGPTLLAWLATHAPDVIAALRRADAAAVARTGRGNAWAQAYGHPILPLSSPRDVRTQVLWGRRDFEHRFGRAPDGMWLPEMAVDVPALEALADAGIAMTMLAPHQAARVRLPDEPWRDVGADTLDTRRLYRCPLPGGRSIDVVFRDAALSRDVPFGPLLGDGARLAASLRAALDDAPDDALVTVAVDGETYGHHHRFGEMALAFALRALTAQPDVTLTGPAAFRASHPTVAEVEIAERTSWSCAHGVERWRADCGCRVGSPADWSQAWRTPLRVAIDWLREGLAAVYERAGGDLLRDPWGARDRYVECLLDPGRTAAFLEAEASGRHTNARLLDTRRALEMARHALLMQTSCGWFFDELTGIEPVQILRYAARAIELAETFGARLEDEFADRLAPARSNHPGHETGAALYRRAARGQAATPARVAASAAMLAVVGRQPDVPGYDVTLSAVPRDGRVDAEARVLEHATGAATTVRVQAETAPFGPTAQVDETSFGVADLFGVQREALLAALASETAADVRAARQDALAHRRALVDGLLVGGAMPPLELARLLGREAAERGVAAVEAGTTSIAELRAELVSLGSRGIRLPLRWLGARLTHVLEARLAALPESAAEALAVLALAEEVGARLDLGWAQVTAFTWRQGSPAAARRVPAVQTLCERLHLAPEDA
jgi:alpha-amylase/alpha-mannosidase (GH57 family)